MKILKLKSEVINWVFAALSILVVILYVRYLLRYSLNVPIWDDYDSGLDFLLQWDNAASFHDKWNYLLSQHNEHRIVLTKLLEIFSYKLLGQINFKFLMWCGNAFLLFIVIFLYHFVTQLLPEKKYRIPGLLLILSMLLSPIQFELQLAGMTGIQNYGQILCSLFILYNFCQYIDKFNKQNLILCMLLNFINMFIGGGFIAMFMALPIGALFFRRIELAIGLFLYFVCLSILFFEVLPYNFFHHPLPSIRGAIVFFCTFWVSGITAGKGGYWSTIMGFIFVAILFFYRKTIQENKFIFCWLIFVFMVNLVLIRTRSDTEGLAQALISRYAIYSLITLVLVISLFIQFHFVRKIFNWIALISFCIFIFSLKNVLPPYFYYTVKRGIFYPDVSRAIKVYEQAKSAGIYENPKLDAIIKKTTSAQN